MIKVAADYGCCFFIASSLYNILSEKLLTLINNPLGCVSIPIWIPSLRHLLVFLIIVQQGKHCRFDIS